MTTVPRAVHILKFNLWLLLARISPLPWWYYCRFTTATFQIIWRKVGVARDKIKHITGHRSTPHCNHMMMVFQMTTKLLCQTFCTKWRKFAVGAPAQACSSQQSCRYNSCRERCPVPIIHPQSRTRYFFLIWLAVGLFWTSALHIYF